MSRKGTSSRRERESERVGVEHAEGGRERDAGTVVESGSTVRVLPPARKAGPRFLGFRSLRLIRASPTQREPSGTVAE